MRSISSYFDLIVSVVEHSEAASAELELNRRDPTHGTVKGRLFFHDGSRLEFIETVTIERYRPLKLFYVYQYIRSGEAVFRYDNAPHHPDLPTFPHHKHVRKERLPAAEPTLSQVVSEVTALSEKESEGSSPRATRRRTKR